ncbi:MAG: acyltransferase [Alcaligenaceae bacterium]|nr:MAG: acyltransferase [Alcaligenaceae bacterium]
MKALGLKYRAVGAIALALRGIRAPTARFEGRPPILRISGRMAVGRNFSTRTLQFRSSIVVGTNGQFIVGDNVFINQGSTIWAEDSIEIGDRVLIGDLACIYDSGAHEVEPGRVVDTRPVTISSDVWIGRNALILPGVTIGRGSVVAAHSVVTKSIPEGVLVAGNPARVVRTFSVPDDFRRTVNN